LVTISSLAWIASASAASTATPADFYAYIILSWAGYVKVDLSKTPEIAAFQQAVAELPAVKAAHALMAKKD
jgi:glutathione S-transferase